MADFYKLTDQELQDVYIARSIRSGKTKCTGTKDYIIISRRVFDEYKDVAAAMRDSVPPTISETVEFGDMMSRWVQCGDCGQPIDPVDRYCRRCGLKIAWGREDEKDGR